ncbi:hypothetical protein IV102_34620 [bacterium]|nr:hypothetical protein [bacterium]
MKGAKAVLLFLCVALLLASLSTGSRPVSPPGAIFALVSTVLLETRATPLAVGYFSPALGWAIALTGLPGVGLPWILTCLACAITTRVLLFPPSPNGAVADLIVDFLPAALAAVAAQRIGLVAAIPIFLVVALALPRVLSGWLAPQSQAGRTRASLKVEYVALVSLGPIGGLLAGHHPALILLVWPGLFALLRASLTGVDLSLRKAQNRAMRAARSELNFQEKQLSEAEVRQLKMQRLLDARAETFELLETLSVRSLSERQALEEALRTLRDKLPGAECSFLAATADGPDCPADTSHEVHLGVKAAWERQEPWVLNSRQSSRAAWPLGQRGVVLITAPVGLNAELQHTLRVFFYYLNLMLERVKFQENLILALNIEAGLRKELSMAVTRLQALLSGASELATLVQPRDILELMVERAGQWTGRACSASHSGIEVGPPPADAFTLALAGGRFCVAGQGLEEAELEALRLWAVLVGGALDRCQAQANLVQGSKLAAIGQLAAGVAHELNTPLASVSMALGMAMQNLEKKPDKARARLELAHKSVDQMSTIVSKLLNYSRESGQGRRAVSLAEVVQDSVQLVDQSFQMENIELLCQVEELLVEVNAGEIQQVLINLLVNARLAVSGREQPQVRVIVEQIRQESGRCARVSVTDNGPGVPPELRERIFEPFFTTRDLGRGVGLGLSLSREIVTGHGGSLDYETGPQGGACFIVSLPLCEG